MIEKKYTLEEITGAWYECYGEYMEDDYENPQLQAACGARGIINLV